MSVPEHWSSFLSSIFNVAQVCHILSGQSDKSKETPAMGFSTTAGIFLNLYSVAACTVNSFRAMNYLTGLQEQHLCQLTRFIVQRQKEDGAFAACPSLPSTVADTYYSLSMLKKLGDYDGKSHFQSCIDRKKIRAFVRAHIPLRTSLPLRVRFFLHEIFRLVAEEGASYDDPCEDLDPGQRLTCENYFYAGQLSEKFREASLAVALDLAKCTGKDVYYFLLSSPGNIGRRPAEIIDWLQRCQNCDGGFGFFPGTTSYIEYSDYSLSSLGLLHQQPLHYQKAEHYLLACRTAAGGFSRSPGAAPFLDASYHGLNALFCLGNLSE